MLYIIPWFTSAGNIMSDIHMIYGHNISNEINTSIL
jgi:hypothetical protein